MTDLTCPHCGATVSTTASLPPGTPVRCPSCREKFTISNPTPAATTLKPTPIDPDSTSPEVLALKAEIRRLRRVVIAGPIVAALVGMLPAFFLPRLRELPRDVVRYGDGATVTVGKLVMLDPDMKVKAALATEDNGYTHLDLYRQDGRVGASLAVGPSPGASNGTPWLELSGAKDSNGAYFQGGAMPEFTLRDEQGKRRVHMGVAFDSPYMTMSTKNEKTVVQWGAHGDAPFMDFFEPSGTFRGFFDLDGSILLPVSPRSKPPSR